MPSDALYVSACVVLKIFYKLCNFIGQRRDLENEFVVLYTIFDENESWYLQENINRYTRQPWTVNPKDRNFIASNRMHGIYFLLFLFFINNTEKLKRTTFE